MAPLLSLPDGIARRKHGPADIERARQLRAGEWSYREIQELLAKDGVLVHRRTVQLWTNPEAAATHRRNDLRVKARQRAARAEGRLLTTVSTPEMKAVRMRALRERAGLGFEAIAAVMRLDFEDDTSAEDARRVVGDATRQRSAA